MKIIIEGETENPEFIAEIAAMVVFDLTSRAKSGVKIQISSNSTPSDLKKLTEAALDEVVSWNGAKEFEGVKIKVVLSARTECPSCHTLCGWEASATDIARCKKRKAK